MKRFKFNKNKIIKAMTLGVLCAVFVYIGITPSAFCATKSNVSAVISVELLSIGGGYLCEPQKTEILPEQSAASALLSFLAKNGYTSLYSGSEKDGFYLAAILSGTFTNNSNGYVCSAAKYPALSQKKLDFNVNIPKKTDDYLRQFSAYYAPEEYSTECGSIGEFSFSDGSGWMYSINEKFLQTDMSSYILCDGDVLRVQYTLCCGSDLGAGVDEQNGLNTGVFTVCQQSRDELNFYIADTAMQNNAMLKVARQNAIKTVQNTFANESELFSALNTLKLALAEAEGEEKESTNENNTVQDENNTVQDENNTVQDENNTVQDENNTVQDENHTVQNGNEVKKDDASLQQEQPSINQTTVNISENEATYFFVENEKTTFKSNATALEKNNIAKKSICIISVFALTAGGVFAVVIKKRNGDKTNE